MPVAMFVLCRVQSVFNAYCCGLFVAPAAKPIPVSATKLTFHRLSWLRLLRRFLVLAAIYVFKARYQVCSDVFCGMNLSLTVVSFRRCACVVKKPVAVSSAVKLKLTRLRQSVPVAAPAVKPSTVSATDEEELTLASLAESTRASS